MKRSVISMVLITLLCSACGQMGPLHLPDDAPEKDKKEEARQ